jgi:hypothetical protein
VAAGAPLGYAGLTGKEIDEKNAPKVTIRYADA